MSLELRGHILNQRQLDAMLPVLNDRMHGKVSEAGFEQACVDALEKAGCPLGYDTGIRQDQPLNQRVANWIVNGRVGSSSKAIWLHMTGTPTEGEYSHPYDPDDLNRCLLLLDLIPEWKPRMSEMAVHSIAWAALAERWEEITACFLEEVGLDWCNGNSAQKTYAMMKQVLGR
jgi:hypothetical protein